MAWTIAQLLEHYCTNPGMMSDREKLLMERIKDLQQCLDRAHAVEYTGQTFEQMNPGNDDHARSACCVICGRPHSAHLSFGSGDGRSLCSYASNVGPINIVGSSAYHADGRQEDDIRCDLLPTKALLEIGALLMEGSKAHKDEDPSNPRWLKTTERQHINRAITHLFHCLASEENPSEDHLLHAATRLLFAVQCRAVGPQTQGDAHGVR